MATFSNCLSSNSTSVSIRLCVGDLPVVTLHPSNASIVTRAVASFRATATGVPPVTGVFWEVSTCSTCSFGAISNSSSGFYSVTGTPSDSTLTLTNGTYGNGWRYRASFFSCLRTGLGTSNLTPTNPATLCTGLFPNVTVHPRPALVASPRNVSFSASSIISPMSGVSVGWDVLSAAGDEWVSVDTNPQYAIVTSSFSTSPVTSSLTFVAGFPATQIVRARFSNCVGTSFSNNGTFTLCQGTAPAISQDLPVQVTRVSGTVVLTVAATATPAMETITWEV